MRNKQEIRPRDKGPDRRTMPIEIKMPLGLDQYTAALVLGFAEALANKLLSAEEKYGHNAAWKYKDWKIKCQHDLVRHVNKGDPRDVAAYCAFMWHHGWSTAITNKDVVTRPVKKRVR